MKKSDDIRIGVLSVQHKGRPPFGMQTYFFEDMIKSMTFLEQEVFFFSPLNLKKNVSIVRGFQFLNGSWKEVEAEVPSIIYDRAFSSDADQKEIIESVRRRFQQENKTILNPLPLADLLNDKVAFHELLAEYHIPTLKTWPIETLFSKAFQVRLAEHRFYVKPTFGSKGQGIFVIAQDGDVFLLIDNLGKALQFDSYEHLVDALKSKMGEEDRYFLQREAEIAYYEGAPFDIRVLVQNYGDDYQVTGKAVRVGQQKAVTSNLNAGGSALPFMKLDEFFRVAYGRNAQSLEDEIDALCLHCAEVLKKEFGDFCEIGFDVLITKDLGPIIIEGNAKPSRWVFVKIADYLKEKGEDNSYYTDRRNETVSVPMKYAKYILKDLND